MIRKKKIKSKPSIVQKKEPKTFEVRQQMLVVDVYHVEAKTEEEAVKKILEGKNDPFNGVCLMVSEDEPQPCLTAGNGSIIGVKPTVAHDKV